MTHGHPDTDKIAAKQSEKRAKIVHNIRALEAELDMHQLNRKEVERLLDGLDIHTSTSGVDDLHDRKRNLDAEIRKTEQKLGNQREILNRLDSSNFPVDNTFKTGD